MSRSTEICVFSVHDLPCAVRRSVRTGGSIGEKTVSVLITPRFLESVLREIVRSLLNVGIVGPIPEVPSGILYHGGDTGPRGSRVRLRQRGIKVGAGAEMGPKGSVRSEQGSHLLQIAKEGSGLVVIGQATEHM